MWNPDAEPILYPPAFAERVVEAWAKLDDDPRPAPAVKCVGKILDVLYQASFLNEEGEPVRCRVLLGDPEDCKQGDGPPSGFHVLRFAEPSEFTPKEIRKLAPAASYMIDRSLAFMTTRIVVSPFGASWRRGLAG